MPKLASISLKVAQYDFTVNLDMQEKGLKLGDAVHCEIPHGTKTFIVCYVDRAVPGTQSGYARMFFN